MNAIIVASSSKIRIKILKDAGVVVSDILVPSIEESQIKQTLMGTTAKNIALQLSKQKALSISCKYRDAYVIGADQTLCLNGKILSKPKSKADVKKRLLALSDNTHTLYSGISVAKGGKTLWLECFCAHMTVRPLRGNFIDWYVDMFGDKVKSSVGGYHFEREGVQLFRKVDGDYFTILGLPLLQLLNFFHSEGVLYR